MCVPVIGVLDTDCDPSLVDIVIPGNDDALKSVRLILDRLISAVEEGGAARRESGVKIREKDTPPGEILPADEPRPTRGRTAADLRKLRPVPKGGEPAAPSIDPVETAEASSESQDGDAGAEEPEPAEGVAAEASKTSDLTSD